MKDMKYQLAKQPVQEVREKTNKANWLIPFQFRKHSGIISLNIAYILLHPPLFFDADLESIFCSLDFPISFVSVYCVFDIFMTYLPIH